MAIYVKKSINSLTAPTTLATTYSEQIWCVIQLGKEKILCGCIYRSCNIRQQNTEKSAKEINNIIKKTSKLPYNGLLICGDFNYPKITWSDKGFPSTSCVEGSKESQFINLINKNSLRQWVTNATFQTAPGKNSNKILDLVITDMNPRIKKIFHTAPLQNIHQGHHVLLFNYELSSSTEKYSPTNKILYTLGKFDNMINDLNNIKWHNILQGNISDMYDKFLNIYKNMCTIHIPIIKIKEKKNSVAWQSPELKHLINKKKRLWHQLQRDNNNIKLATEYKIVAAKVKHDIRKSVEDYELDIAVKSTTNPKLVYKYINSKRKVQDNISALSTEDNLSTNL